MGRLRDSSNAERDRRICLLRRNGFTFSEIAQMEDISRVRAAQVYHQRNPELEEDVGRAEIAGMLEFAERKTVELINDPGWMMAPTGGVAHDDDGEPVPNKTIVNEALKTLILVADRKSRLYGWDKQQQKQRMAEQEARDQMQAHLAGIAVAVAGERAALEERHRLELEAVRQSVQPPVVRGEVLQRGEG